MSQIFCLLDDKNPQGLRTFYENDKKFFKEMNDKKFGVYFAVNLFEATEEEMKKVNVPTKRNTCFLKKLRYAFGDLDIAKFNDEQTKEQKTEKKIKLLEELKKKCQPTKIIETANGLQPLWKLKPCGADEATQKKYVNVNNGIIEWSKTVGAMGDAVKDCCRILRLPNYYHHKKEPFLVEVIDKSENEYSIEELAKIFPFTPEPEYEPPKQNFKLNDTAAAVERLDIKDVVVRAFSSIGRQAEFNKRGEIILDGRSTGTHQGRKGDRQFIATSSHEPFKGNKTTVVADILNCTNKEAYKWIVEAFGITKEKIAVSKLVSKKEEEGDPIDEIDDNPLTWGTKTLDDEIQPIEKHHSIIIAGEQGAGKTTYTFDMAIKNVRLGHSVLFISVEENSDNLFTKKARDYAGIKKKEWRRKVLITERQNAAYKKKKKELKAIAGLKVVGGGGTEMEVDTRILKELILKHKANLVFVDNFDLIRGEGFSELDCQQQKSKFFRDFTNEYKIPIVVIHHENKKSEGINKIRGSGKITDDADCVIMLNRDYNSNKTSFLGSKERDWGEYPKVDIFFDKGTFRDEYIPPQNKKEIIEMDFNSIN